MDELRDRIVTLHLWTAEELGPCSFFAIIDIYLRNSLQTLDLLQGNDASSRISILYALLAQSTLALVKQLIIKLT